MRSKRMVELQDWDMLLSDKVKRSHLLFPEKEKAERYIVSLPFGLEKKDRVIDGVVKGQNLQNLFFRPDDRLSRFGRF